MKKKLLILPLLTNIFFASAQSYAPPAGQPGTTAIHKDSSAFIGWASGISVERGFVQIDDTTIEYNSTNRASFGEDTMALGKPNGTTTRAVSLGDGGVATLTFEQFITNGDGWDFAVFENGVTDDFLEFAFVEVSSDGEHFFRFPSHSEVQFTTQTGGFAGTDCRYIHNLAGKYRVNYGTPFDLDELPDTNLLDKNAIQYVRIIDVIGNIQPEFASKDAYGNIINDPYPTPFHSSGFDLTGVGIINGRENPSLTTDAPIASELLVYPTVVETKLYVSSPSSFTYAIYTSEGKQIKSELENGGINTVDVSFLPNGIYWIKIENKKENNIFRIVK